MERGAIPCLIRIFMVSQFLKIYRTQQWSFKTSIYLFRNRKLGNFISIATIFFAILIPSTLVVVSGSLMNIVQNETRPYSYFIFKPDVSEREIERFVGQASELWEIKVDVLSPEKLRNKFFKSLGIDIIDSSLNFPYSAQVVYPLHITMDKFKSHHENMSSHEIIQSAESNHGLLIRARLAEKGAIGFIWITLLIITIFCALVSYVSSKNVLLLYSEEIKSLILSGLALKTIRLPIIWCGAMNGVILGTLLYFASVLLAEQSSILINEYLFFLDYQSKNWGESESHTLVLILASITSYTLGAIIASRQIKAEILIE